MFGGDFMKDNISICHFCRIPDCSGYPLFKCCECVYFFINERGRGFCFMSDSRFHCIFERKESHDWWKEYDDLNIFVKIFWWIHDEFLDCLVYLLYLPLNALFDFLFFIKDKICR